MKRWWRTGLSGPQVEQLQRDARILLERYGPKAREIALQRAAAYRHRHFRGGPAQPGSGLHRRAEQAVRVRCCRFVGLHADAHRPRPRVDRMKRRDSS